MEEFGRATEEEDGAGKEMGTNPMKGMPGEDGDGRGEDNKA